MRVRRIASIVVVLAALAFAPSALADHQHWMETPAGCREDVAKGQTRKGEDDPGGHKYHENVHTGTPGEHAFANERNPVSVGRDSCP
jgi:hypothetical protein